jgi:choline dehydrogenase-like flavoprotein
MPSRQSFDALIVGSGPAGVSAAFALLERGLSVGMVDGGGVPKQASKNIDFLSNRFQDAEQWQWMIGEDFHAVGNIDADSPKHRVPGLGYAFEGFAEANKIDSHDFKAYGSLAAGGLSNVWGCGVAKFSASELARFPFNADELSVSYDRVARRIGISGNSSDELSDYFGLDHVCQPPIALDQLASSLFHRYQQRSSSKNAMGFRLGRSRVAVLSQSHLGRQACDLTTNCLWGCARQALYTARDEIGQLQKYPRFSYFPGHLVTEVLRRDHLLGVACLSKGSGSALWARKLLLAAGTLATTRLALKATGLRRKVPMQSTPTAAFLLWLPKALGAPRTNGFGLGQLSYSFALKDQVSAFGSLFSTTGIPVSDFARRMPLGRRQAIDVASRLLSSCLVGNVFLPGNYSNIALQLGDDDRLLVKGSHVPEVAQIMNRAKQTIRSNFRRIGALMMPMSFSIGSPGSDAHYACSLPMTANPGPGETDKNGQLFGLPNLYVVDGASLSSLPAKSHTLTIMANADRIGRFLAGELR